MYRLHASAIFCVAILGFAFGTQVLGQERQQNADGSPPAPPSPTDQTDSQTRQAQRFIDDFDENGDGVLEKSELPPRIRRQFSNLDSDNNQQLSRQELEQHAQAARRRNPLVPLEFVYIWVTDADRGQLSLQELQRAYDTLQKIDKDGNGDLSRQELQACRKANLARWARMVINRLDDNDDDKISEDEAEGSFLAGRFDDVDSNGDGTIERSELQRSVSTQNARTASDRGETRTSRQQSDDDQE